MKLRMLAGMTYHLELSLPNLALCRLMLLTVALSLSSTLEAAQGLELSVATKLQPLPVSSAIRKEGVKQFTQASSPEPASASKQKPLDKSEPRVLIADLVVQGVDGNLQDEVYRVIRTAPGRTTTRSQLQEDINAIFATGFFSNVRAVPSDTPLGVRVTFEVTKNPVFQSVRIQGSRVLPAKVAQDIFTPQYGRIINLRELQEGIQKLSKWYVDNGYVLAQVLNTPRVNEDGTVIVEVAEGVIESIQIRFINQAGGTTDSKGKPIQGTTPVALITRKLELKPEAVFNRQAIEKDMQRIFGLGFFQDVSLSIDVGSDSRKVVLRINVVEKRTDSLNASLGVSSRKGAFGEIVMTRGLVDYALSTNDDDVIASLDSFDKLHFEAKRIERSAKTQTETLTTKLQAIEKYKEVIQLAKARSNLPRELEALIEIGNLYESIDAISQSIDAYTQALNFIDKHERQLNESNYFDGGITSRQFVILLALSNAYKSLGEYQQALLYTKKLQILLQQSISYKKGDPETFANLRKILGLSQILSYFDLNEKEISTEAFQNFFREMSNSTTAKGVEETQNYESQLSLQQTMILLESTINRGNKTLIIRTLNDSMKIFEAIKKKMLAQPQLKDVPQLRDYFIGFQANFLSVLGAQYREIGENETALNLHHQALLLYQQLEQSHIKSIPANSDSKNFQVFQLYQTALLGKASTLKEIGTTLVNLDRKPEAIAAYQKALKLFQDLKDKREQGLTLVELGKAQRNLNQYQSAVESFDQALIIWREFGAIVNEANTRLEIARAERDRNNLTEAQSQIEKSIQLIETEPPPLYESNSLSEQKQFRAYIELASYFSARQYFYDFYIDLLMQLHQQSANQRYLVQAFQVSEQSRGRSLMAIFNRRDRYVPVKEGNANIKRPQDLARVATLKEIQRNILDDDSVVLEYALGEERSYLWVISKTNIQSYQLPKRSDVETAARKFYDFLTVPSLRVRSNKVAQAGQELSQMLLGAASKDISGKRLLIVGDGILQYIPFNALPIPNLTSDSKSNEPLIIQHEIVSLPSVSTFAAFRNEFRNSSPSKTAAVFADPVFGYADDRIRGQSSQPQTTKKPRPLVGGYQSPLEILSEQIFPRLPNTKIEASEIGNLMQPTEQSQNIGFAASRQSVLNSTLDQYRILHFATHGTLDATRPERSGMLLSVLNSQGDIQRSLLSTPDTFNLKLSADLVILSGCRTGLGQEIKGEGIIGLTGGLMYAGAKRVVVSLWSVDDQATATLMSHFYKGMLQQNLTPAQALRNAQLEVRKNPLWQNSFYWAGFVLQGEWR